MCNHSRAKPANRRWRFWPPCARRSDKTGACYEHSPVQNYKRIFQTGWQQCSDKNFRRAGELVRNGRIGKLHTVRCSLPGGRPDYGKTGDHKAAEGVPKGFHYDTWLGPTPKKPNAPARCHVNFRWIYDYSGGQADAGSMTAPPVAC